MQKLQLIYPASKSLITQGFSENANESYARDGLIGHTAVDWGISWGNPIINCAEDAYCYSVMNRGHMDPMKYRAVFTLVNAYNGVSEWSEVSYGHLDEINAEVGKMYQPKDILGTCGNTGTVFTWGREVTLEEKLRGSKAGTHLHGPQVRPVKRVKRTTRRNRYLYNGSGIFKKDGYYFEIINYENGTNGCINPVPFFVDEVTPSLLFKRDLYIGMRGDDVRDLQKYLNQRGFRVAFFGAGSPGNETDYFGRLSQNALIKFQRAKGIYPPFGYFGPITRDIINNV